MPQTVEIEEPPGAGLESASTKFLYQTLDVKNLPPEEVAELLGDFMADAYNDRGEAQMSLEEKLWHVSAIVGDSNRGIEGAQYAVIAKDTENKIRAVLGYTLRTKDNDPQLFDYLSEYPWLKTVLHVQETAVDADFRGHGLAEKMRNEAILMAEGVDGAIGETQNPFSARSRARTKNAYTLWAGVPISSHSDLVHPEVDSAAHALSRGYGEVHGNGYLSGVTQTKLYNTPAIYLGHVSESIDRASEKIVGIQNTDQNFAYSGILVSIYGN